MTHTRTYKTVIQPLFFGAIFFLCGLVPLQKIQLHAAQNQSKIPPAAKLTYLIQNSIAAINHANITGNYAVFRDLGAPNMIAHSSPSTLAEEYRAFRTNGIDLSPLLMITPKLTQEVMVNKEGVLTLVGYYPSKPLRTLFNLGYRNVAGRWRLEIMKLKLIEAKQFKVSQKNINKNVSKRKKTIRLKKDTAKAKK